MAYNFTSASTNYPQGANTPIKRVKQKRAPTIHDGSNFTPGDEWLDTSGNGWWKFVKLSQGVALWEKIGAPTGITETLTGNSGGAVDPDSADNINVVGDGTSITIAGNPATHTLTASVIGGIRYPISPYVVGPVGQAGYQTIQSAINAAHAAGGGTVYIQPGTYTENLTLYSGVDLFGAVGISDTDSCVINGTHTPPLAGAFTIRNIWLQSSTNIFSSNGAGASAIILIDINLDCNGYTFNLPNWTSSGSFTIFDGAAIGSTNDGVVNNTGGATVFMTTATIGAGSANAMITSGFVELFGCVVQCPVNFQTGSNVIIDGGTLFDNTVTLSNNSTGTINNSSIYSGSSAALTMSSSGSWMLTNCTISSSHNPAIAGSGAGTITIGTVTFTSNTSIANTLTVATTGGIYPAGNVGTSGKVWVSNGVGVCPTFGTAPVAGGGTGDTSFTAYSVICGGTTSTGPLQNVSGVGSLGEVLTSNGGGTLPTWQPAGGGGTGSNPFRAYLTGSVANVTGDGTVYSLIFNATTFDPSGGINTGTGVFTAPTTGYYLLGANVTFNNFQSGPISMIVNIVATSITTVIFDSNAAVTAHSPSIIQANGSCMIFMTAGDTAFVQGQVTTVAGTLIIGITGGSSNTIFYGFQVA